MACEVTCNDTYVCLIHCITCARSCRLLDVAQCTHSCRLAGGTCTHSCRLAGGTCARSCRLTGRKMKDNVRIHAVSPVVRCGPCAYSWRHASGTVYHKCTFMSSRLCYLAYTLMLSNYDLSLNCFVHWRVLLSLFFRVVKFGGFNHLCRVVDLTTTMLSCSKSNGHHHYVVKFSGSNSRHCHKQCTIILYT